MKLARIILPERNNDNQHLTGVHQVLRERLMFQFGGYTMTKGIGGWNNTDRRAVVEPVFVYDIAMERADTPTLRRIAAQVAADAHQDCVMMVTPNGDVEFVKPLMERNVA